MALDVNSMCRLCSKQVDEVMLFNIFDDEAESVETLLYHDPLPIRITKCLGRKVSLKESLPVMICNRCLYYINRYYTFKEMCMKTNSKLHELFGVSMTDKIHHEEAQSNKSEDEPGDRHEEEEDYEEPPIMLLTAHPQTVDPLALPSEPVSVTNCRLRTTSQLCKRPVSVLKPNNRLLVVAKRAKPEAKIICQSNVNAHVTDLKRKSSDAAVPVVPPKSSNSDRNIVDPKQVNANPSQNTRPVMELNHSVVVSKKTLNAVREAEVIPMRTPAESKQDTPIAKTNYVCTICNSTFSNSTLFTQHHKTHSQMAMYGCTHCSKMFTFGKSLVSHMRTFHSNEDDRIDKTKKCTYKCIDCGKVFVDIGELEKHMKIHSKDYTYKRSSCTASFMLKAGLKRHESTVHGNNFVCKICQISCLTNYGLNNHLWEQHREKLFICDSCSRFFLSAPEFEEHKKSHLPKPLKIPCGICEETFSKANDRKTHLKTCHPRNIFVCDICSEPFLIEAEYHKHKAQHKSSIISVLVVE